MAKAKLFVSVQVGPAKLVTLCMGGVHLHRVTVYGSVTEGTPTVTRCDGLCMQYECTEFDIDDAIAGQINFLMG